MVANVVGFEAAIVEENKVVIVMVGKPKWKLELMAINNKEDIVKQYVLMLYNPDIYLNKDDEEGDLLEE